MSILKIKCVDATPKQMAKGMKKVAKKYPEVTQRFIAQEPAISNKKGNISTKKMSQIFADEFCAKKDEKFCKKSQNMILAELGLYKLPKDATIKDYFNSIFKLAE